MQHKYKYIHGDYILCENIDSYVYVTCIVNVYSTIGIFAATSTKKRKTKS